MAAAPKIQFRPLVRRSVVPKRREPSLPPQIFLLTQAVAGSFKTRDLSTGMGRYYHASKAIDGYSGDDGTFPIVAHRVYKFYFQCDRAPFYEPLSTWEEIR